MAALGPLRRSGSGLRKCHITQRYPKVTIPWGMVKATRIQKMEMPNPVIILNITCVQGEGDRSMFSANDYRKLRAIEPKNGHGSCPGNKSGWHALSSEGRGLAAHHALRCSGRATQIPPEMNHAEKRTSPRILQFSCSTGKSPSNLVV